MKKRDFLTLADFSSEEILDMLDEAVRLNKKWIIMRYILL